MKGLVWILALLIASTPLGFAKGVGDFNLPQLGQAGGAAISQAKLDEMGQQALIQIRSHHLLLQDPLVVDYIRDVGQRIASHSNAPGTTIRYFVIGAPVINAFALPGDSIFIFTGLLLQTDNENELAGVIAHETAHVTQHHIARQIQNSQDMGWKSLAGLLAGIILAAQTGNPEVAMAATMGTQAMLMQHQINFTRHEESEADRVGIGFLAAAGFDPDGMAEMFQKMQVLARGQPKPPAFLLNHPLNSIRITEARNRARDLPDISHPSSRGYLLMRARARVLTAAHVDHALAYFNGIDTAELSGMERDAIAYGRGLCLIRLNRADDALAILKPLRGKHADVVAFHLAVAKAELKRDNFRTAIAGLQETRRVFPDSLAVNVDYAQALLAAGQPAHARRVMKTTHFRHPRNPRVLQLLAKSASQGGNTSAGRYYLSQYYELNGRLMPAIDQLQLALNDPKINHYEQARYQARLDKLKHTHKEHANQRRRQLRNGLHFHVGHRRPRIMPWQPVAPVPRIRPTQQNRIHLPD